jgi:NAD+ diphosphatase
MKPFRFCPWCGVELVEAIRGDRIRRGCPSPACGFVHWANPTPVVAAIIEHEGKILLARGKGWPEKVFALVTGFLEANESPQDAVLREVKEETDLDGTLVALIGVYPFEMRNELIVAFHVRTTGVPKLNEELEAYKLIPLEKLRAWEFGTGLAVADFIKAHRALSLH